MAVPPRIFLQTLADVLEVEVEEIDLHSGFVNNGGNSLNAVALASRYKKLGIPCTVHQVLACACLNELLSQSEASSSPGKYNPQVEVSSDEDEESSRASSLSTVSSKVDTLGTSPPKEIDCLWVDQNSTNNTTALLKDPMEKSPLLLPDTIGLSEMQASLLHGSLRNPRTNIIYHYETYPTEIIPSMKQAWNLVMENEPIFRTSLYCDQSPEEVQRSHWTETTVYTYVDYQRHIQDLGGQAPASVFKVVHWCRSNPLQNRSTIVWAVHHALIDGYSASLLFRKVRRAAAGLPVVPGPSYYQVEQEIRSFREQHKKEGQQYWKDQAPRLEQAQGDLLLPAPLPYANAEPDAETTEQQSAEVSITTGVTAAQLQSAVKEIGVTPATILFAAWALVLGVFADSDTVIFGAVMSGRNIPVAGVDEVIGPLVNTLPLCVSLDSEADVACFLRDLFKQTMVLAEYQWTTPDDGYTRSFASALGMQVPEPVCTDGVSPVEPSYTRQTTDVPLSINVSAEGAAKFVYHINRFSKHDVERIGAYYQRALQALIRPHAQIKACQRQLLGCHDLEILMKFGNCLSGSTTAVSVKDDLVTLFEHARSKNAEAVAVQKGQCCMTYEELDVAAGRVAAALKEIISDGEVVCVHADRSINWIVAMFGVLKAKGVYCAVDGALPCEARDVIFSSSEARILLVPSTTDAAICPSSCKQLLVIEQLIREYQPLIHCEIPRPWANAYLCFTSGSTGRPKGVMCSHEGLVAFQRDLEVRLFAQPGRRISQLMSVAFDGSIHEIFSALCYGATLVLNDGGGDLFSQLRDVDSAILTPSMARVLDPLDYPNLDTVYLVGEPVPPEVSDRWSVRLNLYNMYGPTEGTCGATIKRLHPHQRVTIGAPNPSTRIYIMNRAQQLVPPGVVGEIYLAGVQVARKYIGMPQETAERFVPDPIRRVGENMYKTGDQGYWADNGEVVCLGRTDRQIKLQGFRLDLDDLETRMARAVPDVTAVAVIRQENHLVAAILPANADVEAFRARVAQALPAYATPRKVFALDEYPTTKAGKLDYKALERLSRQVRNTLGRSLRSDTERLVAEAFRDILKLSPQVELNAQSSFRELGGHSLLQLLLTTRLSRDLGKQVQLRVVDKHDVIADLAKVIDYDSDKGSRRSIVLQSKALGESALSPVENEWWRKYQVDEGSASFNVSFVATLDPTLVSRSRLAKACNEVLARHRILSSRYVFCRDLGRPIRQFGDQVPRVQRVKSADVWTELNRPFLVSQTAPIRVLISETHIIITMSHIVADLTTLQTLLGEISTRYVGGILSPSPRTYTACTLWDDKATQCDKEFWSEYMHELPSTKNLLGHTPNRIGYRGTSAVCEIPETIHSAMRTFLSQSTITAQQLALAAVSLSLDLPTAPGRDSTDVILGIPYINRKCQEDMDVVGLFLEPLPVRIRFCPSSCDSESYLEVVQRSVKAAVSHAIPWNQLLGHLNVTAQPPNHPLFETVVTFHNRGHSRGLDLAVPGFETCYTFASGAKFRLLCEFSMVSQEKLLLRLEHDQACFSADQVQLLQRRIPLALMLLMQNVPYTSIKQMVADPTDSPSVKVFSPDVLFGTPLSRI